MTNSENTFWFEKIKLHNYRSFKGSHELLLSQNRNTIIGNGGAGKTNLMSAITWCLYGKKLRGQLANRAAAKQASNNEPIPISVELFVNFGSQKYCITRSVNAAKSVADKVNTDNDTFKFVVYEITSNGGLEEIPNPVETVTSMMPETISKYYFIDELAYDEIGAITSSKERNYDEQEQMIYNKTKDMLTKHYYKYAYVEDDHFDPKYMAAGDKDLLNYVYMLAARTILNIKVPLIIMNSYIRMDWAKVQVFQKMLADHKCQQLLFYRSYGGEPYGNFTAEVTHEIFYDFTSDTSSIVSI